METELLPRYDSRKSFYGKARIETTPEGWLVLISYDTKVAVINPKPHRVKVYGTHSSTTLRHIKEFLKQNGFRADSKQQIIKDYMEV
jgi:hypothetical protein